MSENHQCKHKQNCEFEKIRVWILEQRYLLKDIWRLVFDMIPNNLFWRRLALIDSQNIECQYCLRQQGFVRTVYCHEHYGVGCFDMFPFISRNGNTYFFTQNFLDSYDIIHKSPFREFCTEKCRNSKCSFTQFPLFCSDPLKTISFSFGLNAVQKQTQL